MIVDAWRLSVGTLTAIRVRPPRTVDRRVARDAMLLAPLAVAPLALLVGVIVRVGSETGLAPFATGMLAVGALAVGSRAFHLDGLADTADGLTASYDRERALAVMKTGDVGPAGASALVIVLGIQAGCFAALTAVGSGPILAGVAVIASRGVLAACCTAGLSPARPDGLGSTYVASVPKASAAALCVALTGMLTVAVAASGGHWWRGPLAAGLALVVVGLLLMRATARLGGVTGDIFGASVELSLAALLLTLSVP